MEPKTEQEVEIGSAPALLGAPRETLISVFFYSHSPEGPRASVPELHKNVSCREPEICWGPRAPHVVCVSPRFVFVSSLVLCFLFGRRRGPLTSVLWEEEASPQECPRWLGGVVPRNPACSG